MTNRPSMTQRFGAIAMLALTAAQPAQAAGHKNHPHRTPGTHSSQFESNPALQADPGCYKKGFIAVAYPADVIAKACVHDLGIDIRAFSKWQLRT